MGTSLVVVYCCHSSPSAPAGLTQNGTVAAAILRLAHLCGSFSAPKRKKNLASTHRSLVFCLVMDSARFARLAIGHSANEPACAVCYIAVWWPITAVPRKEENRNL